MAHCPTCHTDYEAPGETHAEEAVAEEVVAAEVRIAEINANRDIQLAKIQAKVVEHVEDVEQAAELAHAEGEVEGMEKVLQPEVPEQGPESPVVVVEPPAEPGPSEDMPPIPEAGETVSEPHEKHKKSQSLFGF